MNEQALNSQSEAAHEKPNIAALKKRSKRTRIINKIAELNSVAQHAFDLALIGQLQAMDDGTFDATIARVMAAIAGALRDDNPATFAICPRCDESLEAPDVETQIASLMRYQQQRPLYYSWSPFELRALREHLRRHPGHVLMPNFAQSCDIREPSGLVYTFMRDGKVK